MDAQNVVESDQARSGARDASPSNASRGPDKRPDRRRSSHSAITSPNEAPSKPERFAWAADDASDEPDSDAETVVLPGKDGHSPSKARKVRQEDKSDGESDGPTKLGLGGDATADSTRTVIFGENGTGRGENGGQPKKLMDWSASSGAAVMKKKIISGSGERDRHIRVKDTSSGLSSAPTSPPQRRRRRSNESAHSGSESDHPRRSSHPDRLRLADRPPSHKRKAPRNESDGEADHRRAPRQRTTSAGTEGSRPSKDSKPVASKAQHGERDRSASPHARTHRRSASTQLVAQPSNGIRRKTKHIPAPLRTADELSDDSSTSGSPHPRSSKLRSLATPSVLESITSPAKKAVTKTYNKHLDAHGQTQLARACARGDRDGVVQRLGERPEDVNVADYAGNTPLQIAAINGRQDIVKLLLDAGCNLDCVNYDKDTPLLDAVDNGHVVVVRMLLDAGVNPRKANREGHEPIDRVEPDTENGAEIRALLLEAKRRVGERRRTSEDRQSQNDSADARESQALDSPRRPSAPLPPGAGGRRGGTVRAQKTRNDLLYISLDDPKILREAAGNGDEQIVAQILQVRDHINAPEAMVAAARGGHDTVLQLLLGLGNANPDPGPVAGLAAEFATPILAAIGQENLKVVELLLEQQRFNPSRHFKGEAYHDIARRRQGTNWKEEEQLLKNAYDDFKNRKDGIKVKSPTRKEDKRSRRDDAQPRAHRRTGSSPDDAFKSGAKLNSPKEKRRSGSYVASGDERSAHQTQKRVPGRPSKTGAATPSDRELSPMSNKVPKSKLADTDPAAASSDGEATKPRRKLISKGKLRGEKDKIRRSSVTSNASSLKEPTSPNGSRHEESSDKHRLSATNLDRTKLLKRDEAKDPVSSGDGSAKRHRASMSPEQPSTGERGGEGPTKRRRLDDGDQEKRPKRPTSSDGPSSKPRTSQEGPRRSASKPSEGARVTEARDAQHGETDEAKTTIKLEDADAEMPDAAREEPSSIEARVDETEEEAQLKRAEERKRAEVEEKKRRELQETTRREQEEARRKKEEESEAQRRKEAEEAEEAERREAADAKRREEERKLAEEEQQQREEQEKKQREAEERLRQIQLEEEAAEELRRKREREAREEQDRLERERAHREELERKRTVREAEQRRIREEQERARLDKLPPLLQWFDLCPNPKTPQIAELFKRIQGARYDTIRPGFDRTPEGRELWLLSTHVALLLGEKDPTLSRYTAWDRVPAGELGKVTLWRLEQDMYTIIDPKFYHLGRQLPGWVDPKEVKPAPNEWSHKRRAAWEKFRQMDMFWIRASDFLYTVSQIPHLRGIEIAVEYRELIETEAMAMKWGTLMKWKDDPNMERFGVFCPRASYYVNGQFVREDLPQPYRTSKTPFPERRVPRRGLSAVNPDDPDYDQLCKEQGLDHLIRDGPSAAPSGSQQPSSPDQLPNGIHRPLANGHPSPGEDSAPDDNAPNGASGTNP